MSSSGGDESCVIEGKRGGGRHARINGRRVRDALRRGHERVTRPRWSRRERRDHRTLTRVSAATGVRVPRSGRRDRTRARPCPAEPRRASRADSSRPCRSITPALIVWRSEKSSTLRDCSMTSGSGDATRRGDALADAIEQQRGGRGAAARRVRQTRVEDVRRLTHHAATEVRRRRLACCRTRWIWLSITVTLLNAVSGSKNLPSAPRCFRSSSSTP